MKAVIRSFNNSKVRHVFFVLTCVLLAGVLLSASMLAEEIAVALDKTVFQMSLPW